MLMTENADQQLQAISVDEIKEVLSKIAAERYDRMYIPPEADIHRSNYFYVKFEGKEVIRQAYRVNFPYFGAIRNSLSAFEGGKEKFGKKAVIESEKLFETLSQVYNIEPNVFDVEKYDKHWESFPLELQYGKIAEAQPKYFLSELTYHQTCETCNGEKYEDCPNEACKGRHEWDCDTCEGEGNAECARCDGTGEISCDECKGKGRKDELFNGRLQLVECDQCGTSGRLTCPVCEGEKVLICKACNGDVKQTCDQCYAEGEGKGKIDCPECQTIGETAQVVYVTTEVKAHQLEDLVLKGEKLNEEFVTEELILDHCDKNGRLQMLYHDPFSQFDAKGGDAENQHDEYSKELCAKIAKNLGVFTAEEKVYYEVIPCIQIDYTHILTNTRHQLSLLNVFKNPEVVFHSEPEKIIGSGVVSNSAKVAKKFFTKVFNTKGYQSKEDKKNEIVLMIYLMRADGVISEEEKKYVADYIGDLDAFTNAERQQFFDLMNVRILPELTEKEVEFSSEEKSKEVLINLKTLAKTDGNFASKEEMLINKIKKMMEEQAE
ncbi:hypothetical protein [Microscilla marina]|uniref:Uncharacterized protein n=1 Tax=Microscilla marina ATCC 23134 TaxID=313606 RepID=A1ZWG7_MICM2|nr:hypothetical protein [Microscilla marina]EAY25307.1 hypothetical protein M23134_02777 [Microscilla marina ATCC 23134]